MSWLPQVPFLVLELYVRGEVSRRNEKITGLFNSPRPVRVESVCAVEGHAVHAYPGVVSASDSVQLAFRVGGPLIEVAVELGDRVEKDALLMQIDPRDYEDQLSSLRARRAGAKATLGNAQADFNRAETLFSDEVIAQAQYDGLSSTLALRKAQLDELDAAIRIAEHRLADSSLRAPYAGVITRQYIENFEMVTAGKPVLAMANMETLEVSIDLPEGDMPYQPLRKGAKAELHILALLGHSFEVAVKEWSTEADSKTQTYLVTFALKAPTNLQVLPGMSAEVYWQPKSREQGLLSVPVCAVLEEKSGSYVWVYDATTQEASKRAVKTGRLVANDRVVVLDGLVVGEPIVTAGVSYVQPGMKLQPLVAAGDK